MFFQLRRSGNLREAVIAIGFCRLCSLPLELVAHSEAYGLGLIGPDCGKTEPPLPATCETH